MSISGVVTALVDAGFIDHQGKQQIEESSIEFLSKQFQLDQKTIAKTCAEFYGLAYEELDLLELKNLPLDIIDDKLIQQQQILPIALQENHCKIAVSHPDDFFTIDHFEKQHHYKIEVVFVEHQQLQRLFSRIHNTRQSKTVSTQHNDQQQATTTALVRAILQDAIQCNASDIHFEAAPKQLIVRMRIDGLLYQRQLIDNKLSASITTHLKILANCDIAEKRLPQDGRFQFNDDHGQQRDCRVSVCPTLHGEKIVIRLLNPQQKSFSIAQLGLNNLAQQQFQAALQQSQGLILVTGPTGSGKSITLYSAISLLNNSYRNISTIEEPVEMPIAGVNQVNVNTKAGLNFANALRAFLRQDPDIMMVGEIRDHDTADIAIRAAQTGHLVLASLHTNNAPETCIRLLNMGVAPFNIASALKLVIAQRLARRLCDNCKIPQPLTPALREQAQLNDAKYADFTCYTAGGCEQCINGYKGRIGIFSLMPMTEALAAAIIHTSDHHELAKHAKQAGMQSLWEAALEKVGAGETSLTEIYRVI